MGAGTTVTNVANLIMSIYLTYKRENIVRISVNKFFYPRIIKPRLSPRLDTHEVIAEVLVGTTKSKIRFPVGTGKLASCLFNVQRSFSVST